MTWPPTTPALMLFLFPSLTETFRQRHHRGPGQQPAGAATFDNATAGKLIDSRPAMACWRRTRRSRLRGRRAAAGGQTTPPAVAWALAPPRHHSPELGLRSSASSNRCWRTPSLAARSAARLRSAGSASPEPGQAAAPRATTAETANDVATNRPAGPTSGSDDVQPWSAGRRTPSINGAQVLVEACTAIRLPAANSWWPRCSAARSAAPQHTAHHADGQQQAGGHWPAPGWPTAASEAPAPRPPTACAARLPPAPPAPGPPRRQHHAHRHGRLQVGRPGPEQAQTPPAPSAAPQTAASRPRPRRWSWRTSGEAALGVAPQARVRGPELPQSTGKHGLRLPKVRRRR